MKWFSIFAVTVVAAIVVFFVAHLSTTIRYRLTLEAELNGQPKIGSGVIQVSYSRNARVFGAAAALVIEVVGEAVSVDLGNNDALFALLTPGNNPRSGPEYIIPVLFGVTTGGIGPEDIDRIGALTGRRSVPFDLLPLLVRFPNERDPKSAELFNPKMLPTSSEANLTLKSAFIEIVPSGFWLLNRMGVTGVPISRGVTTKLNWLTGFTGLSGGQSSIDRTRPEKNLVGNDFIRGALR